MSQIEFFKFLQTFRNGAASLKFLDQFVLNSNFTSKTKEVGSIADSIHLLFQQAAIDTLKIKSYSKPDYLKQDLNKDIENNLKVSIGIILQQNLFDNSGKEINFEPIVHQMITEVYTPMYDSVRKIDDSLKIR